MPIQGFKGVKDGIKVLWDLDWLNFFVEVSEQDCQIQSLHMVPYWKRGGFDKLKHECLSFEVHKHVVLLGLGTEHQIYTFSSLKIDFLPEGYAVSENLQKCNLGQLSYIHCHLFTCPYPEKARWSCKSFGSSGTLCSLRVTFFIWICNTFSVLNDFVLCSDFLIKPSLFSLLKFVIALKMISAEFRYLSVKDGDQNWSIA